MYPHGIIEVQVRRQAGLDLFGCVPVGQDPAQTLFLDGPVEPLDVGVVVRPMESAVAGRDATAVEVILKVPTILWPVVGLDHGKDEAEPVLGSQDHLGSNARPDPVVDLGVGHAAVQVYDGVDVAPPFGQRTDVVHGVGLDEFAWFGNHGADGVAAPDPRPAAVYHAAAPENTPDTTETDGNAFPVDEVVPDHFGAAS